MNLKDVASLTLSLDRLHARVNAGLPVDDGRHSLRDNAHVRAMMSSYAVVKHNDEPVKVMGAASFDGKSIPCARCGGMFEPTEEMLAEYAKKEEQGRFQACALKHKVSDDLLA